MPRRPIVIREETGYVNVRTQVPDSLWAVAVSVGRAMAERWPGRHRPKTDELAGQYGLAELLKCVGELFAEGKADWLPSQDFAKAIAKLKDANYGTLPTPGMTIDISKLHRNPKLKSGFHGVYANGNGFRAMSRDFAGKPIVLKTCKTVEEAAHVRMLYHRQHNLPYGELEVEMELWRSQSAKWGIDANISDEHLIAQIRNHHTLLGTLDMIFGPNCVSFEPVVSAKLPRRADVEQRALPAAPQRALPAPAEEPPRQLKRYVRPEERDRPVYTKPRPDIDDDPEMHNGPCECWDGCGACDGCGAWLADAYTTPEQPANSGPPTHTGSPAIGFAPDDLPESLK